MSQRIATEVFYEHAITRVIHALRVPLLNDGYKDDFVTRIQTAWKKNLEHRLNHRTPLLAGPIAEPTTLTEKPVATVKPPERADPEIDLEEDVVLPSDFSVREEDSEPDLDADEVFRASRQEEENKQEQLIKRNQAISRELEERVEDEEDSENLSSDHETDLNHPEAENELVCMYDLVNRRGSKWKLRLRHCVLQTARNNHHVITLMTGDLEF